jgi:CheY-like chemotaxis protein
MSVSTLTYVQNPIDEARNGQEALDYVIQNEQEYAKGSTLYYDMIFLDLGMPLMDGYDACKNILKHYNNIDDNINHF